jgi:hypothetical protein
MKKISSLVHNPLFVAALGLTNLLASQGNIWMMITGLVLIVIAAMDAF